MLINLSFTQEEFKRSQKAVGEALYYLEDSDIDDRDYNALDELFDKFNAMLGYLKRNKERFAV